MKKGIILVVIMLVYFLYAGEEACAEGIAQANEIKKSSKPLKVLMVGNSMTYSSSNSTIENLRKLAQKAGRKIKVKRLTSSGEKLKNWINPKNRNGKKLYKEIKNNRWDYIIFQEYTDASISKSFTKTSKKISKYIKKHSPKTQIIFNCTWAYRKGKKIAGKYYSYNKMQKKMNKNYERAAKQTNADICWSGKAFQQYRKRKGKKKPLYRKDNNHASKYGWYLNACCLYSTIFKSSPKECRYYGRIGKKTAKIFQNIAYSVISLNDNKK